MLESISKLKSHFKSLPLELRVLFVIVLIIGFFFRFANLDLKRYWHDEVYTSFRISGHTQGEFVQEFSGKIVGIKELQKYQRPNPKTHLTDTINGLAREEPQLTPLYFVLARIWSQLFGSSVAAVRSLSAVFNLLSLPLIYWLCCELFNSPITGLTAIILMSTCPLQVIFSQEARPYSLWTLAILLFNIALLRALRVQTPFSWLLYALSVSIALYSYLLSFSIILAYGLYVLIVERWRGVRNILYFTVATLAGIVTFLPWIFVILTNQASVAKTTAWQSEELNFFSTIRTWAVTIGRLFVDFWLQETSSKIFPGFFSILTLISLILVAYSFYYLCCTTPLKVWLFVTVLTAIPALLLLVSDLLLTSGRLVVVRYQFPSYMGILLGVAYFLSTKVNLKLVSIRKQKLGQVVLLILVSLGILSNMNSFSAATWWNKHNTIDDIPIAHIINQTSNPLLITNFQDSNQQLAIGNSISMSYILKLTVNFLFLKSSKSPPEIPPKFSNIFVLMPQKTILGEFKKKYNLNVEKIYPKNPKLLIELVR